MKLEEQGFVILLVSPTCLLVEEKSLSNIKRINVYHFLSKYL